MRRIANLVLVTPPRSGALRSNSIRHQHSPLSSISNSNNKRTYRSCVVTCRRTMRFGGGVANSSSSNIECLFSLRHHNHHRRSGNSVLDAAAFSCVANVTTVLTTSKRAYSTDGNVTNNKSGQEASSASPGAAATENGKSTTSSSKQVVEHSSSSDVTPPSEDYTRPMTSGEEAQILKLRNVPEPAKDFDRTQHITAHGTGPDGLERIHKLPLTLIEEIPKDVYILPEIEMLMHSWSEEQYLQLKILSLLSKIFMGICLFLTFYMFYRARVIVERRARGVGNMPMNMKIGSIVYLDMGDEAGNDIGRIVIGLLNEDCPLYCEYFHRRCTGNGPHGESFVGCPLQSVAPGFMLIFGEGEEHLMGVPGYHEKYLPTEYLPDALWRGAVCSVPRPGNKQTGNFAFQIVAGEHSHQVFGLVMAGYDVVQKINNFGTRHGSVPKIPVVVKRCGELCTLDKTKVMPLPWQLFDSISWGYDEDKFGQTMASKVRELQAEAEVKAKEVAERLSRPWWKKVLFIA